MDETPRLSAKSVRVLQLLAAGRSYSQILDSNADLSYPDIFFAAEEAIWLGERIEEILKKAGRQEQGAARAMELAKQKHPRAYLPWSDSEDSELASMHSQGISKAEIAMRLQRQDSAIQSRLRKLGLEDS